MKNAYRATARDGESPVVSQADLLHGAQLQLRGALRMKDFDRRRIPTRGLEAVLLPKELKANLDKIVHHEKVVTLQCPLLVGLGGNFQQRQL